MQSAKYILPVFCALTLASCGNKRDNDKQILAVSIEPQRQILEQIAGPSFEVMTVLGKGADPETFDPSTSQRVALEDADIYFATDVLPFEDNLRNTLTEHTRYVPTSGNVRLIYGTHSHDHHSDHNDGDTAGKAVDPHYWSSFEGVGSIASSMLDALIDKYPDLETEFRGRYSQFIHTTDSLKERLAEQLASADYRTFAVWHPSLSYFAREFSLEQLPRGVEGKDMSAKALAEAIDHARADSVKVFFFQPGIDSRQAEVMNEGIGSKLVAVNLLDYNWPEQLKYIADEIARPQ